MQTLLVLLLGLAVGSAMVFTVVWSGTKQHLEEKRLKEQAAQESTKPGS